MNQRDDLGTKTPGDWLSVVREGQDWRFPECYGQGRKACAGVPAPTAVLDRHAAAGGVAVTLSGPLARSLGSAAPIAEWTRGVVKAVALSERVPRTRAHPRECC